VTFGLADLERLGFDARQSKAVMNSLVGAGRASMITQAGSVMYAVV
jgi:hypothetical protein